MGAAQALTLAAAPAESAPEREEAPPAPARGPIDHAKTVRPFDYAECLKRVAQESGKSAVAQMVELWRLFLGPGKITPFDYYYYGLWSDRFTWPQKQAFVGIPLRAQMTNKLLDTYFYGVGLDKIAFYACMAGFGLPTPATLALFHATRRLEGAEPLASREAFEAFLRRPDVYPNFCKPAEATASLGSASLERYHPASDEIELSSSARFPVARFVEEAARYFGVGYLVQERLRSHPEIHRITGEGGLSTIRLMVLDDGGGARVLRATWRLPRPGAHADVYWRGNLMAALDPETGVVQRVVTGNGLSLKESAVHPDTGAHLLGRIAPEWPEVRDLGLRAAAALPKLSLTGWDISVTDRGPVVIELEPDGGEPTVTQLASGVGLLDGPYGEFLRNREAAAKRKTGKRK